ncbi:MAG: hypothetical protein C4523_14525 [Myxococcales bacterium]|nr:MAG: hypothetical protein C4523_14525 [Myxococcales bacterium]
MATKWKERGPSTSEQQSVTAIDERKRPTGNFGITLALVAALRQRAVETGIEQHRFTADLLGAHLAGSTVEEIAEKYNIPPQAVRDLFENVRDSLSRANQDMRPVHHKGLEKEIDDQIKRGQRLLKALRRLSEIDRSADDRLPPDETVLLYESILRNLEAARDDPGRQRQALIFAKLYW